MQTTGQPSFDLIVIGSGPGGATVAREVARLTLPDHGRDGFDYVLIGRRDVTATRDFAQMRADLEQALGKAHG